MDAISVPNAVDGDSLVRVFQQTTTLESLLDFGKFSPFIDDPLELLPKPAVFSVFEGNEKKVYSLSLPEADIRHERFRKLLYQAHNRDDSQDIIGIVADWSLLKRHDNESKARIEGHAKALAQNWTDFVGHHWILFTNAIRHHGSETDRQDTNNLSELAYRIVEKRAFIDRYYRDVRVFANAYYTLNPKEQSSGSQKRRHAAAKKLWEKHGDSSAAVISAAIETNFQRFGERLASSDMGLKGLIMYDSEKQKIYSNFVPGETDLKIVEPGIIRLERLNVYVTVAVKSPKNEIVDKGVMDYVPALVPWIVWEKCNGGSRNYFPTVVPQELAALQTPESNTLAGLLVALSFSPAIRKTLPKEFGIYGRRNDMREAQIPVLALMYQSAILRGSFFNTIENYVDRQIAARRI